MALVRILVDGQGLLQNWGEIASGKPRRSAQARRELLTQLTAYYDAAGVPLTVVFDGPNTDEDPDVSTQEVEVVFSKRGQTPVQALNRLVDRYRSFGAVLVVADDPLEPARAHCQVQSIANFIAAVTGALADLARNISRFNEESQSRFNRFA